MLVLNKKNKKNKVVKKYRYYYFLKLLVIKRLKSLFKFHMLTSFFFAYYYGINLKKEKQKLQSIKKFYSYFSYLETRLVFVLHKTKLFNKFTTIKSFITNGFVSVNNVKSCNVTSLLKKNDVVTFNYTLKNFLTKTTQLKRFLFHKYVNILKVKYPKQKVYYPLFLQESIVLKNLYISIRYFYIFVIYSLSHKFYASIPVKELNSFYLRK